MAAGLHGERGIQLILCGCKGLNREVSQNQISAQLIKVLSHSSGSCLKLNGLPNKSVTYPLILSTQDVG